MIDNDATPKLLSVSEFARRFGVSRQTAYRWAHSGELPSVRLGGTIRVPTKLLDGAHQKANADRAPAERPRTIDSAAGAGIAEAEMSDLASCRECGRPMFRRGEVFCGACEREHERLFERIMARVREEQRQAVGPVDSSRDAWGKPRNDSGGPEWINGNCLRSVIATMKRWNIDSVPDPAPFFGGTTDWFVSYNDELGRSCGIRLEEISPSSCPPAERQWIAALSTPTEDDVDHAVIASGHVITHDPNGRQLNGSYISRNGANALRYGLRLVAANAPRTDAWGRPIR